MKKGNVVVVIIVVIDFSRTAKFAHSQKSRSERQAQEKRATINSACQSKQRQWPVNKTCPFMWSCLSDVPIGHVKL